MRSKYHAKPKVYDGRRYDSTKEAEYAKQLDALRSAHKLCDRVVRVERQVRVPFVVNGVPICEHRVDFLVQYGDGRLVYEEVKGYETAVYKLKRKLFTALYPDRTYRIVGKL